MVVFISAMALLFGVYFRMGGRTAGEFYFMIFVLGLAMGYWAMFVTMASEQFGTNIRSTVTTTVPNFVRGTTVGMTLWWTSMSAGMGIVKSAMIIGAVVLPIAVLAVLYLKETHGKELDYVEE